MKRTALCLIILSAILTLTACDPMEISGKLDESVASEYVTDVAEAIGEAASEASRVTEDTKDLEEMLDNLGEVAQKMTDSLAQSTQELLGSFGYTADDVKNAVADVTDKVASALEDEEVQATLDKAKNDTLSVLGDAADTLSGLLDSAADGLHEAAK